MKRGVLFLLSLILIYGVDCAFAGDGGVMHKKSGSVLIAYFSWSGNTQYIVEKIHSKIGGTMCRIETKIPYPDDYHEVAYGIAKKQYEENILPELKK